MNRRIQVLIVNSDQTFFTLASKWLEPANHLVLLATTGSMALKIAAKIKPHIIFVDASLPDEGSLALCQKLKTLPNLSSSFIYLLANQKDQIIEADCIDDYLVLPVMRRELLAKIKIAHRLVMAESCQEIFLRLAVKLNSSPISEGLLPTVLAELQELFFADSISLTTLDNKSGETVVTAAYGKLAHLNKKRIPKSMVWIKTIQKNGNPLLIEDVQATRERFAFFLEGGLDQTETLAVIPLKAQGEIFGILWLGSGTLINQEMMDFLTAVANMIGSVLQQGLQIKAAQENNILLEERVLERTNELSVAYDRLQELSDMKTCFVANVSHELRLPISNLLLYQDLLKKGNPDKRTTYEEQLSLNIERLYNLVEDILSLSRLEARQNEDSLTPICINDIVPEAIKMVTSSNPDTPVKIHFKPHPNLPLVHSSRTQLLQVFTNLFSNAIKHTAEGNILVTTALQPKKQQIYCTVQDEGMGILPEDLPNIFKRFYRGRQSVQNQIPGSGLGLAIVREIVNQHKGSIDVKSVPGKGSTFIVRLPASFM